VKAQDAQPTQQQNEATGSKQSDMRAEALIDKVFVAHGGQEKLRKLMFTQRDKMTKDKKVTVELAFCKDSFT
jgi:hypothetical protein